MSTLNITENSHRRLNILTGDWVLVSPHRSKRPWQGKTDTPNIVERTAHDPACYLCAGNKRIDGTINPNYTKPFVFENDFAALLKNTDTANFNDDDLLVAENETGICKVICFSPKHNLSLAEMTIDETKEVVKTWQEEFTILSEKENIKYIQIFENKGDIMGCSNPHPHGQVWATSNLPTEIVKETERQEKYWQQHKTSLLSNYLKKELALNERIVFENNSFVVLVPFWATWPFETIIISKRHVQNVTQFTQEECTAFAEALNNLLIRYDNLFETSFPYSAGMHQQPVNSDAQDCWHWHMHFYPPLLRNASIKKFMVGYEMLASPQRDITPEYAAAQLKAQSTTHYKKRNI
jgi:UDPglucose--hexose-1-phosphate uridylyltransferase